MKKTFISLIAAVLGVSLCAAELNELHKEVAAAIKAGKKSVVLTRKEYRISKPLGFHKIDGFTLDGNGAAIIVTNSRHAITIHTVKNLVIKNLAIDYDPLPFTQGVITKVDEKAMVLDVDVDEGYPPVNKGALAWNNYIFTPDGSAWKKDQTDFYAEPTILGARKLQLTGLKGRVTVTDIQVGDKIVICRKAPDGGGSVVEIRNSGKLTFENMKIYSSYGCVFRAYHCDGDDVYRNVKIGRGPTPAGAKAPRLFSSNHDGIHYGYCTKGVTIENCDFGWMGDDSFNHHGTTSFIAEVTGKHTFNMLTGSTRKKSDQFDRLKPGTKIRILHPDTFDILGEYTFESYRYVETKYPKAVRDKVHFSVRNRPESSQAAFEIKVKEELKFTGEARFDIPGNSCYGFVVRNSYFHDHRARGLRIMASNGLVENCRFERIKGNAISIGGQYSFWGEAGWVSDVTIRNCTFKENGFGYAQKQASDTTFLPGVIAINSQLYNYKNVPRGNRRITIENNVIAGAPFAGIFVMAAKDINITGNKITNVMKSGFTPGSKIGLSDMKPVWVQQAENVNIR